MVKGFLSTESDCNLKDGREEGTVLKNISVVLLLILGNGVLDWNFCWWMKYKCGQDVIQRAEKFSGEKQRQQTLPRLWGN